MKSKELLTKEAFKLYSLKSYADITLADLEKATNLSRGTILYHFKKKEDIFNTVLDIYIFNKSSIELVDKEHRKSLLLFINSFTELCRKRVEEAKKEGIKNVNLAMMHIESSGFVHYPNMQKKAKEWYDKEVMIWKEVILNSIEQKEIKSDINIDIFSRIFEDLYIGTSSVGVTRRYGIAIDHLNKNLQMIYNLIKV